MGAWYDSCHLCGEELSGRYREGDDYDTEPSELAMRRRVHEDECIVRRTIVLYVGLVAMAEAIRQRCTCPPGAVSWRDVCERCKGYP